jgi:hypothetical protein
VLLLLSKHIAQFLGRQDKLGIFHLQSFEKCRPSLRPSTHIIIMKEDFRAAIAFRICQIASRIVKDSQMLRCAGLMIKFLDRVATEFNS